MRKRAPTPFKKQFRFKSFNKYAKHHILDNSFSDEFCNDFYGHPLRLGITPVSMMKYIGNDELAPFRIFGLMPSLRPFTLYYEHQKIVQGRRPITSFYDFYYDLEDECDEPFYNTIATEETTSYFIEGIINLSLVRKENNTMNRFDLPIGKFSRTFDSIKNELIDYGIEYSTTKIKQYFGHEIILNKNFLKFAPEAVKSYIIEKFIKKYDKKFDSHFEVNCFDREDSIKTYTLKGTKLIIPICMNHETIPDTFIYVAYGNIYKNPLEQYIISSQNISLNDMYIYLFGSGSHRLMKEFKELVDECYNEIHYADNHESELSFFSCTFDPNSKNKDSIEALYVTKTMVIKKNIDDLVYSHNEKDKIINHLDKWLSQESFCKKKGLLYKTGILLYGDPGTGKSSLANAIASKYHRSIISIDVNKILDLPLNELAKSISCDETRYIVLFEDLDVIMLDRENDETKQKGKEIINKMLQFLDSNTSPRNVIFIGTTNYYNKLDPALIRDGRFDLKVEVKGVKDDEAKRLCKEFDLDDTSANEVINVYHQEHPEDKLINQSALQNVILRKMDMMLIDSTQENINV